MKCDMKAAASAAALVWGAVMFSTAVLNLMWPEFGGAFLETMASVYPGYEAEGSAGQAIIAGVYGLLDGAIVGALFACIYNKVARTAS